MDFSVVKKAGLYQHEFGDLCGVSRVTVNLWVRTPTKPHPLIRNKVKDILSGLQSAVSAGALPIPNNVPKKNRMEKIRQVVTV